ncbi:glycosyltransferase family 4 protein [Rhizobium sp. RU20A]|uniref:glycosyltransferase family 4 protein n=1 Tax=Rhizobium sp. RU20A TaxID=1907412 RepID=UPI00245333BC|nr:glycosyltransferase family 4 protein [Rhizobium sp. RU20A]
MTGLFTSNISASKAVLNGFADYPARYKSRLKLIYNGVQSRVSPLSKAESRQTFGLSDTIKLMVCCGRLSQQKNHVFLLQILAELPDVHLAILGDGELRQTIEDEATRLGVRDRLHLVGELPAKEVGRFLRAGDVFVFPSRFEAFGLALAEAMLEGLPVVTSNHPALMEVVGEAGFVLPLEKEEWKSAVERLTSDADLREEMGLKARAQAKKFTYEAMFAGYLNEIVGSNGKG